MNKKVFLILFCISLAITTFGKLIDSDTHDLKLTTEVFEFFGMFLISFFFFNFTKYNHNNWV